MSDDNTNYPKWFTEFISDCKCQHCGQHRYAEDFYAVAVVHNQYSDLPMPGPICRLHIKCHTCETPAGVDMRIPREWLLGLVAAVYDNHPDDPGTDPGNDPDEDDDGGGPTPGPGDTHDSGGREEAQRAGRPRKHGRSSADARYGKRPTKAQRLSVPPTDKETTAFLNRLGRTSFKRTSKSYRDFMDRLGVCINKDGTYRHKRRTNYLGRSGMPPGRWKF